MANWYGLILVGHIVAVISWMAGLLYLPRLFVYHSDVSADSEAAQLFKTMERRLLHAITVPAAIAAWLFGGLLIGQGSFVGQGWLSAKLGLVLILTGYTVLLEKWRRDFACGRNGHRARFFRMVNEIPALLMIGIVALVILKPF